MLLGLILVIATGQPLSGPQLSHEELIYSVAAGTLELLIPIAAARRFKQHKGLMIGSFALVLFLVEFALKIAAGGFNIGWVIFEIAVGIALLNGVRAASAYRKLGRDTQKPNSEEISSSF